VTSVARRSLFWGVLGGVVVLDFITKQIAVATLSRGAVPVLGDWLVLRLVYNPGAAFGIHVGEHSRWVFTVLALAALVVLGAMVRQTRPDQWFRLTALALVCGGAVGNLGDRLRSGRGVVDFIDVWIGSFHWPTFNVADMAVSCGAVTLAIVLWNEGRESERAARRAKTAELSP
jgi:signal peptidase II